MASAEGGGAEGDQAELVEHVGGMNGYIDRIEVDNFKCVATLTVHDLCDARCFLIRMHHRNIVLHHRSYKGHQCVGPFKNFTSIIGPNGTMRVYLLFQ